MRFVNFLCWFFGHRLQNVDTVAFSADCSRCDKKLEVSYDMTYGETIIVGVVE